MSWPIRDRRWKGFDYTSNNFYFITSCVENRLCWFGEIQNEQMFLNSYGSIVEQQWHWLEQEYSYLECHAFVVMPNHFHGILKIDQPLIKTEYDSKLKPLFHLVGALKMTSSRLINIERKRHPPSNLPSQFKWQRSFHDRVIRNQEEYVLISNYIENNPLNWDLDEDHF